MKVANVIKKMKCGETIYINAISLSCNEITTLRTLIINGGIIPIESEVRKAYKDVESVMCGEVILPQMTYQKL